MLQRTWTPGLPAARRHLPAAALAGFLLAASAAAAGGGQDAGASGQVVDPDGRPVAGAALWLDRRDSLAGGPNATSGADGRFTLAGLPREGETPASLCRAGYETQHLRLAAAREPVRIVLAPSTRVAGQVVGPDGRPLAGVTVSASYGCEPSSCVAFLTEPCPATLGQGDARSDAQGRFVIDHLQPGWYDVRAQAEGYLGHSAPTVKALAGQETGVDLTLSPSAEIAGRVVDADGGPAAGVHLSAGGGEQTAYATTGPGGEYRLRGVKPGPNALQAQDQLGASAYVSLEVEMGENRRDVTLDPAPPHARVRGRALGPDGRPAASARVEVRDAGSGSTTAEADAGADGAFELRVRPGTWQVWASLESVGTASSEPFAAGEGDVEEIEVRLKPWGSFAGRVSGLEPGELRGLVVWTIDPQGRGQQQVSLDAAGRFALGGLTSGPWQIKASLGSRGAAATAEVGPGRETTVELAFPAAFEVSGRMLGPREEPLAGTRLAFSRPERQDRGASVVTAGEGGAFSARLEEGTYRLEVLDDGYYLDGPREVIVAGGPVARLAVRAARGATIRGQVLGLTPPRGAARIDAVGPDGQEVHGWTDQEAQYRLRALSPGLWRVLARHSLPVQGPDHREVQMLIEVRTATDEIVQDLDLALGEIDVAGRILADGPLPPEIALATAGPGGAEVAAWTRIRQRDRFKLHRLRPGHYRMLGRDSPAGEPRLLGEVDVAASGELVIDLRHQALAVRRTPAGRP